LWPETLIPGAGNLVPVFDTGIRAYGCIAAKIFFAKRVSFSGEVYVSPAGERCAAAQGCSMIIEQSDSKREKGFCPGKDWNGTV